MAYHLRAEILLSTTKYNADVALKLLNYLSKEDDNLLIELRDTKTMSDETFQAWCYKRASEGYFDRYDRIVDNYQDALENRTYDWIIAIANGFEKWENSPIATDRYNAPKYWFKVDEEGIYYPITREIVDLCYRALNDERNQK